MMAVFRSNNLIHAPECRKCILRDPNFQNFPGPPRSSRLQRLLKTPSASFSISPPTSQILPSTPFLIENPVGTDFIGAVSRPGPYCLGLALKA